MRQSSKLPAVLFRNTLSQSSAVLLGYLASLIVAPIMLSRLGLAAFGVWAVTGAATNYVYLLDLGIGRSLSRFIALYDAVGDRQAIRECVGLGLIAVTLVASAGLFVAVLAAPLVARLLGYLDVGEMRTVLLASLVLGAAYAYGSVLGAVGDGLRRMVPASIAGILGKLLNFSFSIIALILSDSLVVYALANALSGLVSLIPAFVALRYVWRGRVASLPSWRRAREIVAFGAKGQVHWLSDMINNQTDKIIVALLVDVRAAGAYEVGARVALALRSVGFLTLSAMIPTATAHIVQHGREAIPAFYRHYLKLTVALAFPVLVVGSVTAPFLLVGWLGAVPGEADGVLVLLTLGYFVNMTTGVSMTICMGEGRAGLVALYAAIPAVLNVGLTVLLARLFGFWGVLAGTVVAVSLGSLLFVRKFHQLQNIPFKDYLQAVVPPAALSVGIASPVIIWYVGWSAPSLSRLEGLIGTALIGSLYGLTYWIAASRFDFLPTRMTLPRVRRRDTRAMIG